MSRASSMSVSAGSWASTISAVPRPPLRSSSFPNMPFTQPAWHYSSTPRIEWFVESYLRNDVLYERLATGNSHAGHFLASSAALDEYVGMVRSKSDYIPVYGPDTRETRGNTPVTHNAIARLLKVRPKRPTWPIVKKEAVRIKVRG